MIVLDGRHAGTFHLDEVMQAGDGRFQRQLHELQNKLSGDDPINILFTSVIIFKF